MTKRTTAALMKTASRQSKTCMTTSQGGGMLSGYAVGRVRSTSRSSESAWLLPIRRSVQRSPGFGQPSNWSANRREH